MSKTIGERFTNIRKCTLTRESKAQSDMLNAHTDQSSVTKSKGLHPQVVGIEDKEIRMTSSYL